MYSRILMILLVFLFGLIIQPTVWADDDAIMDRDNPYYSAISFGWTESDWAPCAIGGAYYYAFGSDDSTTLDTAQVADITGTYMVYARWTSHSNRNDNARYRIYDGTTLRTTQYRDQRQNGCNWQYLASVTLTSGNRGRVILDNPGATSGEVTVSDAIRFVRITKDDADIVDEAGLDWSSSTGSVTVASTSATTPTLIRSDSVTCPEGTGYVLATFTSEVSLAANSNGQYAGVLYSITRNSTSWDANHVQQVGLTEPNNSFWHRSTAAIQRVDSCSSGTVTYRVYAHRTSNTVTNTYLWQPTLTLLFVPTLR